MRQHAELVHWYNHEHRHSAIGFVTPTQRHAGIDKPLLKNRSTVYETARRAHPNRWSGSVRNWSPIVEVHLNPNTPKTKDKHTSSKTV